MLCLCELGKKSHLTKFSCMEKNVTCCCYIFFPGTHYTRVDASVNIDWIWLDFAVCVCVIEWFTLYSRWCCQINVVDHSAKGEKEKTALFSTSTFYMNEKFKGCCLLVWLRGCNKQLCRLGSFFHGGKSYTM